MCNKMDELMGFPGDSVVKGPPAHAGDMGSIPDPGRSYIPQSNKTLVPQLLSLCSAAAAAAKSLQSYPTLCDRIDGSPPGSPVSGILQARTMEWVAISFSNAGK